MASDTRTHAPKLRLALVCTSVLAGLALRADEPATLRTALRHALAQAELKSALRAALAQTEPGKAHQRTNTLTPLAPGTFNPDTGLRWPTNFVAGAAVAYELRRQTNRVEPEPPPEFNPDPGAALKSPVAPPPPFFQYESVPLPTFRGEAIPEELKLARTNTTRAELLLREPGAAASAYGWEPLTNGLALPRTNVLENTPVAAPWHLLDYPVSFQHATPTNFIPMSDRYRVPFVPWRRYTSGDIETPYFFDRPFLWHPYLQSRLKGDAPILGQDIFLNMTAGTATEVEFRRIPTPSAVSSARPGSAEFFGHSEQWSVVNNLSVTLDLFRGETVFKPVEWAIRIQPIYNLNFVDVQETTAVSPDPRGFDGRYFQPRGGGAGRVNNPGDVGGALPGVVPVGRNLANRSHTQRTRDFVALQEAFAEVHIRDLSDNYDFIAARVGNQTFNSDFRGFIFNDTETGGRIFGNWDNNKWQYNAAAFDMREKDTYSELNSFDSRDQRVAVVNVYRQDAIWKGYTAQASLHANVDDGGTHYDRNKSIVRPAPFGSPAAHEVNAVYFGWAGDGHIGRWNVSHAFYQAVGRDTYNGLAGRPVNINAQMAALEISYDRDWVRYKASFFYASGDGDAEDGEATGFDTIFDNPNFTGGAFSYWVRQGFNFGGTAVNLKQRNSLVPNLRTSKPQGQANFVNPGVFLYSLGVDLDTTPKLRTFLNANYIRFAETDPLETALLTDRVRGEVGWDFSIGWQYRPLLTDNVIASAGFGVLIPGEGFRDIYRRGTSPVPGYNSANRAGEVDDFLYSAVMALTLTY
ncbi:MAG TPA: hypothetical protein VM029_16120 [Opitutaceae bacterium]|nr:hypothetical protein [Opitutaceae bacterium]